MPYGKFSVYAGTQSKSNKYKLILNIDFVLEGYGDYGISVNSNEWDGAIDDLVDEIVGMYDDEDKKWLV